MINQNLKSYINLFSKELGMVIDENKIDKKYIAKKKLLMKCLYGMFNILETQKTFLPKFQAFEKTFKSKSISNLSLKASLKQLDTKIMSLSKYSTKLRATHQYNIIDNIFILTPMMIMCKDIKAEKFLESIAYSNLIDSHNHQSELLMAMFEKQTKKKLSKETRKKFKKYAFAYNFIKKSLSKYV